MSDKLREMAEEMDDNLAIQDDLVGYIESKLKEVVGMCVEIIKRDKEDALDNYKYHSNAILAVEAIRKELLGE